MAETVIEALARAERQLQAGEFDAVDHLCRAILVADPLDSHAQAQAQRFLGLVAYGRDQPAEALRRVEFALELVPDEAVAHDNRSLFLAVLGRPVEAEAAARQALALRPTLANAAHNLGVALLAQGRSHEAETALCRALALQPHNAEVWNAVGAVWHQLDRLPEAAAALRRALELRPAFPLAEKNLRLVRSGLRYRAEPGAASVDLSAGAIENNRGVRLLRERRYADAEVAFRRAVRQEPRLLPEVSFNLARALEGQERLVAVEALYLNVLRLRPTMIECHRYLVDLYFAQRRFKDANDARSRLAAAEAAEPTPARPLTQAEVLNNLATDVLSLQGRHLEARAAYQDALTLAPDYAVIHSNAILNEQYAHDVTLPGLAAAHAAFESRHADPLRSTWRPFTQSRDPDRPLRIGFVSGDLFFHPVGMFLAPLLERLDPGQWTTVCYSNHRKNDFVTARLVKAASLWRQVTERTDEALADQIRSDAVDLLFDLSGHTGRNRLLTFARRPAPVQLSWMGYVGTTGLSAIDYLIADRFHVPPGREEHYREQVLRLPDGYVCYEPPAHASAVGPLPAEAAGRVTFGSFNNSCKITPQVVAVWADILRQVPDALLVLKCSWYDNTEVRQRLIDLFAAAGVSAERVELQGSTSHLEQLAQYQRIDLALDSFPYSGGVTTCEACWMGVPVVTCPGETFASRHSLSHLSNIDLTETITRDLTEYADRAVSLARDWPRLAALRSDLRQRMARSPLCDLDRFTVQITAALRRIWRDWCRNGRPPV